jgi:hypothetical protein
VTALGVALVVAAAACLIVAPVLFLARRRAHRRAGMPGPVEADLVARLTEEVTGWQAEAAHWKETARRLQIELDRREHGPDHPPEDPPEDPPWDPPEDPPDRPRRDQRGDRPEEGPSGRGNVV